MTILLRRRHCPSLSLFICHTTLETFFFDLSISCLLFFQFGVMLVTNYQEPHTLVYGGTLPHIRCLFQDLQGISPLHFFLSSCIIINLLNMRLSFLRGRCLLLFFLLYSITPVMLSNEILKYAHIFVRIYMDICLHIYTFLKRRISISSLSFPAMFCRNCL